ncbi:MAG: hypothetical protein H6739_24480 [Alphaproteobacteria bacterium]|nr:hypothetical protein [Alphaproteobacteria bacterium]
MTTLLLLLACGGAPPPPPAPEPVAAVDSGSDGDAQARADIETLQRRVASLDERLGRIELLLAEMQETGAQDAASVRFDPRRTRLTAKSVQAALDEMYNELSALQNSMDRQNMGRPGDGLFQLPREEGKQGPPPQGGNDGPYGPGGKREGK